MNTYRVYLAWEDGEISTKWVVARNAQHACFVAGQQAGQAGMPEGIIVHASAVLETN